MRRKSWGKALIACFLASLVAGPARGQESAQEQGKPPAQKGAKEPVMPKDGEVRPWEPGEPVGAGVPLAGYWVPAMAVGYPPMGCPPMAGHGSGWHGPTPGVGPWFPTYTIRTGLFGCACVRPSFHHLKHLLHHPCPPCPPPEPPCMAMSPWQGAYPAAMPFAAAPAPAVVPAVAKEQHEPRLRMPPSVDRTASLRRPSAAPLREVSVSKVDVRGRTGGDATRLFWRGYGLYWQGKHSEALALFEAAVQVDDKDARFWYYRSLSESAIGEPTQADKSLEKAVELHARSLPEQGQISQALERVQGPSRMKLREALDLHRSTP